jgi:hypothetical protein
LKPVSALQIQPWAMNLDWAKRHFEEGDNRCLCMLCSDVIGAAEDDPRWRGHDPDCAGCAVCEIAIRIWRGEGRDCREQRYHVACFGKVLAPRPQLGPSEQHTP